MKAVQYRNRSFAGLLAMVGVVFFIGGIFISLTRPDVPLAGRIAPVVVIGLMSTFVIGRLARSGVFVRHDGIRILNPFRTVEIPWEHMTRFTARPHKGFPMMGFAQRIDGTEVELWGVQSRGTSSGSKRIVEELVDQLNQELARARQSQRVGDG